MKITLLLGYLVYQRDILLRYIVVIQFTMKFVHTQTQ